MKPPRPKIHLADRDSPILDYSNVEVRCGQILAHAETKFFFGANITNFLVVNFIGYCSKCLAVPSPELPEDASCYLYGLVEGQAERDAGNLGASEGDNEA